MAGWPNAMASGDVVRLAAIYTMFGNTDDLMQLTFDLQLKQAETDTDVFVGRVEGFIKSLILSAVTPDFVLQRFSLSDLFPGTNPGRQVPRTGDTAANTGTLGVAGDCNDASEAGVVRLRTYLRGQHNRGRIFWPALRHAHVVGGLLDSTQQGDITSTTGGILTALNGAFGAPTGNDHPTWGIWRHVLQRVPSGSFDVNGDAINEIIGRVNYKPVYRYPPGDKALPLTVKAFLPIVDASTIDPVLRQQRRREVGRRISRAHRVPRTA